MTTLALQLARVLERTPSYVHLDLEDLCAELHASKTAVRTAMQELESEGYIDIEQES